MLVLVAARNVWFAQPLFISSLLILIMVGAPAPLTGQSDSRNASVSVLVKPDSGIERDVSPAANGFAKIENSPASNPASLSAQQFESAPAFPNEPKPPRELLMPQSPSQDSFTKPFVSSEEFANELRGDGGEQQNNVVTASFNAPVAPAQDRSKAIGALATTNQSCLLYTSPSPRDATLSRMPSSA